MKLKKTAPIISVILIIILCILWIFIIQSLGQDGTYATVSVSGGVLYTLELDKKQVLDIKGANNIKVRIVSGDGCIYVEQSECSDKICEKKGKISKTNENIVCLPAEVVIEVKITNNENEFDAIT